jgi:DNA-binding transcriptional regulator YbjK
MTIPAAKQPARVRASAVQRRQDIIEATLRVMARDGLRAVSHRAVASEASVPLASTTYYFRDLEDLIIESFLHWSEGQRRDIEAFQVRVLALLSQTRVAGTAEALADAASAYVLDQVRRLRSDRVLEYAFLHEAIRVPRLRAALERQQQGYLDFLREFHAALGSPQPELDAQITNSVLLGLEKSALLSQGPVEIRAVMLRHLQQALQPAPVGA